MGELACSLQWSDQRDALYAGGHKNNCLCVDLKGPIVYTPHPVVRKRGGGCRSTVLTIVSTLIGPCHILAHTFALFSLSKSPLTVV